MVTMYPREFSMLAKNIDVKKTFVSDIQRINPKDCENCGGAEVMSIFLAMKGPFQAAATPNNRDETSHWDNAAGRKGGWWVGKTYTFPCPVCLGVKRAEPENVMPTQPAMVGLMNPHTGEVEVLE